MKLKTYIEQHPVRQRTAIKKQIAKDLGISVDYVKHMCNGIRGIPVKYAVSLEKATNGAVKREDIFPDLNCSKSSDIIDFNLIFTNQSLHQL